MVLHLIWLSNIELVVGHSSLPTFTSANPLIISPGNEGFKPNECFSSIKPLAYTHNNRHDSTFVPWPLTPMTARRSLEMSPLLSVSSISNRSGIHISTSSIPDTPVMPDRAPSPEKKAFQDSNTFLTAVATQERRVLELKEELQKAEVDLEKLKKQWAIHEAAKKRNELRQLEPLQPLSAPLMGMDTVGDNDPASTSREQERRKLKPLTTRQPQRTFFSGSRHTKTLSLLSPPSSTTSKPPFRGLQPPAKTRRGTTDGPSQFKKVPELSAAVPPSPHRSNDPKSRRNVNGLPSDDIVETGKQLVGDLREGLWTFLEDLRQATVGEEIDTSAGNAYRKQNSHQETEVGSIGSSSNHSLTHTAFPARGSSLRAKSLGKAASVTGTTNASSIASTPLTTKPEHQRHMTIDTTSADTDGWGNWDSPPRELSPPQSSASSLRSDALASPITDRSTPRTSTR